MIICISLFHDHKIILNFESFKIKFTIRHSIVTRIRLLSLRSVYENHQSQSIKWANSLDQMTSVFSFKSQNRHPFILCIYIVSSSPCKYQLSFQFHINLTKAVFCHKKIAVFVLWLLYNSILIWISLIIIFYKQIVGDYF